MKDIIVKIIFFAGIVFAGCSDMNDKHEVWMEEGEIIYIGKVDSLKVFPGNEKVKFRFWVSDPRTKSVGFYWVPNNDSIFVDLNTTSAADSFDVFIGGDGNTKTILEGDYTLSAISYDDHGNSSIPFEEVFSVYGEEYRSGLTNRKLKSVSYDSESELLALVYSGKVNDEEIGIEISYTDNYGIQKAEILPDSVIISSLEILDVDVAKTVSYRTIFLPESLAIDTFYSDPAIVTIEETVNVALNKNVTTSDNLNSSYTGLNAVDGVIADASRWVSTASGEHWIEIDFGQAYSISSFETWNGSSGQVNTPIPDFRFQVDVDGEWETVVEETANANANYKKTFPEVTTGKVRFVTGTQTRLFEIAVY